MWGRDGKQWLQNQTTESGADVLWLRSGLIVRHLSASIATVRLKMLLFPKCV